VGLGLAQFFTIFVFGGGMQQWMMMMIQEESIYD
jgi:hypothetical protein